MIKDLATFIAEKLQQRLLSMDAVKSMDGPEWGSITTEEIAEVIRESLEADRQKRQFMLDNLHAEDLHPGDPNRPHFPVTLDNVASHCLVNIDGQLRYQEPTKSEKLRAEDLPSGDPARPHCAVSDPDVDTRYLVNIDGKIRYQELDSRDDPRLSFWNTKSLIPTHVPDVVPRRLYDEDDPEGYEESDRDYMENNLQVCLWFLDNYSEIKRRLERR